MNERNLAKFFGIEYIEYIKHFIEITYKNTLKFDIKLKITYFIIIDDPP